MLAPTVGASRGFRGLECNAMTEYVFFIYETKVEINKLGLRSCRAGETAVRAAFMKRCVNVWQFAAAEQPTAG